MEAMTQERSLDDVFVWPDGTWCYRYEKDEFHHMSDDYMVVFFGTKGYDEFFKDAIATNTNDGL